METISWRTPRTEGGSARKRLLIVEDDREMRTLLQWSLEKSGFSASLAEDAVQAVQQARQGGFDVILLDYRLPAGTGEKVLERLRLHETTRQVPVLVYTGATEREVRPVVERFPGVFFLAKPVHAAALALRLWSLIVPPAPSPLAAAS